MLILKQQLTLPFLCYKSAITSQIDSYKVSNSKLTPYLCNCVNTEKIESTAPPQQPHKNCTILGHPKLQHTLCKICCIAGLKGHRHSNSSLLL